MKPVKIIATLGPSTFDKIDKLLEIGVDIFRLNFSHGTHQEHLQTIKKIRAAKKICAILQDISGPKIRIGKIDGILELKKGDKIILTKTKPTSPYELTLSYPEIIDDLKVGEEIFFADGSIRGEVLEKRGNKAIILIKNSGVLSSHKGVNLPNSNLTLSAITPKDEKDLRFGAKMGVDLVAISFVNSAADIEKARQILQKEGANPWIIAKIETKKGVENLESILKASDGVMVARGDLGIEVGIEKVPIIQKKIIKIANSYKKPVITATQMLLSMVNSPFPTRAEVSDVANAVLDGSDGVMLSDETTIGRYPLRAVDVLKRTIQESLAIYPYYPSYDITQDPIAASVADLAKGMRPKAIVCFTSHGTTAKAIAKYRPDIPIIAVTHTKAMARKLKVVWGIEKIAIVPPLKNHERLVQKFITFASVQKWLENGDKIIVTMGSIVGKEGSTNMIRVIEV